MTKPSRSKRIWIIAGAIPLVLVLAACCWLTWAIRNSPRVVSDRRGYSNLVVSGDALWFGAGSKLHRVDLKNPTAEIVFDAQNVLISYLRMDGDTLFFGGNTVPEHTGSTLWAFDTRSRQVIWKKEYKAGWGAHYYMTLPPLAAEDVVIVTFTELMAAYDKTNGNIWWSRSGSWHNTGEYLEPVLVDGQLVFGTDQTDEEAYAIDRVLAIGDPSQGVPLRTVVMPGMLRAVPAIHDERLFIKDEPPAYSRDANGKLVLNHEIRLNCVDWNTGKNVWTFKGEGIPRLSAPAFYKGLVLDVFSRRLYALDEQTGEQRWVSPELESVGVNPYVLEEDGIVALYMPGKSKIAFLDIDTGTPRGEGLDGVLTSPIFIGHEAIYGTKDAIACANFMTGEILWSIPVDTAYQIYLDD